MDGRIFGHYRILDLVGHGGMGEVYRAEDVKLRRMVALKLLPLDVAGHAVARQRLIREACAASRLSHANIATIYEVDEIDGRIFVSMEYVAGESLARRLERGPLPVSEAVSIAFQIASALAASHDHGVIHRDVKPANVIIGEDGPIKVVDFGLALDVAPPGDEPSATTATRQTRITRTGSVVGTLAYMSPEQAKGERPDPRTDLFSLGVVLYEMVTGSLPFRGDNQLAMAAAIIHDLPVPLGEHSSKIPSGLAAIIERCLTKDRERRPSSAAQVRDALNLLREGHDTGRIQRVLGRRPWRRRMLFGLGVATLVIAATLVGAWLSNVRAPRTAMNIHGVEARRSYEQARTYELRGTTLANLDLAEQMYRKARELDPGNAFLEAHLARFLALRELVYPGGAEGRLGELRRLTDEALAADGGLWPAWVARGRLLIMQNDPRGAADAARKAIATGGNEHDGYIVLGEALIAQGDVEGGLVQLRRAIDVGEGHIWARSQLATALYNLGRMDEAAAEYRRVLDYAPDSPVALNNLGVIYLGRGSFVEAIGLLKRRLEVQPDEYAASNLGTAYFFLDRMDEAIQAFDQAVALAPEEPTLKQNLAEAYEKAGNRQAADHWYGEALDTYDRSLPRIGEGLRAVSLAERAFCAAKLSRFDEALENIRRVLESKPDDMNCLRSAARVQAMVGNRSEAYGLVRRAVAAGYPGEEILNDPTFDPYRDDSAFLRLLTHTGQ